MKGSKYKLLHLKNKLTLHSRIEPDILVTFMNMFKSKIMQAQDQSPNKYVKALDVLIAGTKAGYFTAAITFLSIMEIRKILKELNIDTKMFQTTQLFRQSAPLYPLHYGEITKDVEEALLKMPAKVTPGLEREFVFIFDCGRDELKKDNSELIKYQTERALHIFSERIKNTDRVSVIKFYAKRGKEVKKGEEVVEVICGLTLKEYSEVVLKKTLEDCIRERNQELGQAAYMIDALHRSIWRVKHLKLEKVIIMFFKSLEEYQ